MSKWSFWTNHARALLLIAPNPDARLRDLATELGVTERTAYGIVSDLTKAGYLIKEKNGRRNRYQIQKDLPLPGSVSKHTIGEVLDLLVDSEGAENQGASIDDEPKLSGRVLVDPKAVEPKKARKPKAPKKP